MSGHCTKLHDQPRDERDLTALCEPIESQVNKKRLAGEKKMADVLVE